MNVLDWHSLRHWGTNGHLNMNSDAVLLLSATKWTYNVSEVNLCPLDTCSMAPGYLFHALLVPVPWPLYTCSMAPLASVGSSLPWDAEMLLACLFLSKATLLWKCKGRYKPCAWVGKSIKKHGLELILSSLLI